MSVRSVELSEVRTIDASRWPALLAIVGGVALLFLVGFLQTPAVHNGAHDTRHANGFPCH